MRNGRRRAANRRDRTATGERTLRGSNQQHLRANGFYGFGLPRVCFGGNALDAKPGRLFEVRIRHDGLEATRFDAVVKRISTDACEEHSGICSRVLARQSCPFQTLKQFLGTVGRIFNVNAAGFAALADQMRNAHADDGECLHSFFSLEDAFAVALEEAARAGQRQTRFTLRDGNKWSFERLDRDRPSDRRVEPAQDHAHAPAFELFNDLVAADRAGPAGAAQK